jgi:hypothetical protein
MTMGVEPMHPRDWIEIDVFYEEEMALRREILATRKEVAIASFPEATEANWEVLELLADHLPKQFPTLFTRDGAVIHNLLTGEMFDIFNRSLDPLEISARLVQVQQQSPNKRLGDFTCWNFSVLQIQVCQNLNRFSVGIQESSAADTVCKMMAMCRKTCA